MRCLICKESVATPEIAERIKYIYEVFHIYTFKESDRNNYIMLSSIPRGQLDLLLIIGHDPYTNNYVIDNLKKIKEKNIIVISCNTQRIRNLKDWNDKYIYLPKQRNKINCYDGQDIGFEFDITDEEVMLYRNRRKNLIDMLDSVFEKI